MRIIFKGTQYFVSPVAAAATTNPCLRNGYDIEENSTLLSNRLACVDDHISAD